MKYIHLELSNLIGLFERTVVQIYILYIYIWTPTRLHYPAHLRARVKTFAVDPHLSEPQLSDFPDYPNANCKRSNEIH